MTETVTVKAKSSKGTIDKIRKGFYKECLKNSLTNSEIDDLKERMFGTDSTKDVIAGLKASRQRVRNIAGKKAAMSRSFNMSLKKNPVY